jgi:hypothetical protein
LLVRDRVAVLLNEALGLVLNVDRIVGDGERVAAKARLLEDALGLGPVELAVELLDKGGVGAGRQARLLVKEREDAELAFDDVDARLVVAEVDKRPVDLLADVLLLLELEDVRVKLLLDWERAVTEG